jgi:hypothetical protein
MASETPRGQFTYLTGAVLEASRWIGELRSKPPGFESARIYLFTDGINEPPPGVHGPLEWKDFLSKEFGEYLRDDIGIYVVQLEGTPPMDCHELPNCEVLPPGKVPGETTPTVLRFRQTDFVIDTVRVDQGTSRFETSLSLTASVSSPEGLPKPVAISTDEPATINPAQAEFNDVGATETFKITAAAPVTSGDVLVSVRIKPLATFAADSVVRARVPVVIVPPAPPLWKRPWAIGLVSLLFLGLLHVVLFPRFAKGARIQVGVNTYSLRRISRFPLWSRVKIGPKGGILVGDGKRTYAVLSSRLNGDVYITPSRRVQIQKGAEPLTRTVRVNEGDTFTAAGERVTFRRR